MKIWQWFLWFFFESRRCEHESDSGTLTNMGLNKVWRCKKCGKCLNFV